MLCRIVGHNRSRESVAYHKGMRRYTGACERCGTPMIRRRNGEWVTMDEWRK